MFEVITWTLLVTELDLQVDFLNIKLTPFSALRVERKANSPASDARECWKPNSTSEGSKFWVVLYVV